MSTISVENIWENRNAGVLSLAELETLEQIPLHELLPELTRSFPIHFLELRRGDKWEIGQAQGRRQNKFRRCLFLTSESGELTTLGMMTFLRLRRPRGSDDPCEIVSGGGFSLYRSPGGWKLRLLDERIVSLDKTALKERGWLFA